MEEKKQKQIKLMFWNGFHHSSSIIAVHPGKNIINGSRLRRVKKELCGMSDCCCRSPQGDDNYYDLQVVEHFDGSGKGVEWEWIEDEVMIVYMPDSFSPELIEKNKHAIKEMRRYC
jgi:hypothetical protein